MKITKLFSSLLIIGFIAILNSSCNKCSNENPQARIINNGNEKASVQIKTSGGNTVNINNVDPTTSSPYSSYDPGEITFTITISKINFVKTEILSKCFYYDIAIDANNVITTTAINRN